MNQVLDLASTNTFFGTDDVGLPFYLGKNGDLKTYKNLSFVGGEAIFKAGMVDGMRKVSFGGIQIMTTQPY